jgi:hypothetical protein
MRSPPQAALAMGHFTTPAAVIAAEPVVGRAFMSAPAQRHLRNQAAMPLRDEMPGAGTAALCGGISALAPTDPNDALAWGAYDLDVWQAIACDESAGARAQSERFRASPDTSRGR